MNGADYKSRYSTPDGRVKVLPSAPPTGVLTNSKNGIRNQTQEISRPVANTKPESRQNGSFRLPQPPAKPDLPSRNRNAFKQFENQGALNKVQRLPTQTVNRTNDEAQMKSEPFLNTQEKLFTAPAFTNMRPQTPIISNKGPVSENGSLPCDMTKLRNELAQLKLELASMSEPMKEHDEWLKIQSEQVKELVKQQKELQTSITQNSLQVQKIQIKNDKNLNRASPATPALPPLPTSSKPVNSGVTVSNQPSLTKEPQKQKERERPTSLIFPKVGHIYVQPEPSAPLQPSVQRNAQTSTADDSPKESIIRRKPVANTVSVKRISGIFEAALVSNDKPDEHMDKLKRQNGTRVRKSVAEIFERSVEPKEIVRGESVLNSGPKLNRSKSMYSLKPVPSPKPVQANTGQSSFSYMTAKATLESKGLFGTGEAETQQVSKVEATTSRKIASSIPPVPVETSQVCKTELPKEAASIYDRPLPPIPNGKPFQASVPLPELKLDYGNKMNHSSNETKGLENDTKTSTKPKPPVLETSPVKLRAASPRPQSAPPPPPSKYNDISSTESSTESPTPPLSDRMPPSASTKPTESSPPIPPPLPQLTPPPVTKSPAHLPAFNSPHENSTLSPPPPPPPLPQSLPTSPIPAANIPKSGAIDQGIYHHTRSSSLPITNEGPALTKAQLLEQIREFGKSGKSLKKTPSENGDGGTPQMKVKHAMHDALQTRFRALCETDSDSSDHEGEEEDWSD